MNKGVWKGDMIIRIGEEDYLTAGESATFLGVSNAMFTKYQKRYKLKYIKRLGKGQRKFFKQKDLEPLLAYQEFESGEQSGS